MFKYIKNDLPASIVVFFVALPLCLGIALASGAPLFSGLIAGIVGGIFVGLIVLGTGRLNLLPDFHACCEEETKTGIHHQIPPSSR